MVSLERNGYLPLTHDCVSQNVPGRSGIYTLAIQLPNGVYKTFFTRGSKNIHRPLMHGDPKKISLKKFMNISTGLCAISPIL
jgi:hypothetical protein